MSPFSQFLCIHTKWIKRGHYIIYINAYNAIFKMTYCTLSNKPPGLFIFGPSMVRFIRGGHVSLMSELVLHVPLMLELVNK